MTERTVTALPEAMPPKKIAWSLPDARFQGLSMELNGSEKIPT